MRTIQILSLLFTTALASGCWTVGFKGEAPEQFGHNNLLNPLIGQKSGNVIRELGLPDQLLTDGSSYYMMYIAESPGTQVGVVLFLPIYIGKDQDASLYCLRFKVDINDFVMGYEIESKGSAWGHNPYLDCRRQFWTTEERHKLKTETIFEEWRQIELEKYSDKEVKWSIEAAKKEKELIRSAESGSADAQLRLFKKFRQQNPTQALKWLCMSADQGEQEARYILGYIYEHDGRRKFPYSTNVSYEIASRWDLQYWVDQDFVRENDKLAYLWYSLGGETDNEKLDLFAERELSVEEKLEAERLIREWKPGQCERDFDLGHNSQ